MVKQSLQDIQQTIGGQNQNLTHKYERVLQKVKPWFIKNIRGNFQPKKGINLISNHIENNHCETWINEQE